jgi:hypothetical protein
MQTYVDTPPIQTDERLEPTPFVRSRHLFVGISVAFIWLTIAAATIWSPDMIAGSNHERLALVAATDWFYAAIATGLVLMAFGRRSPGASGTLWLGFTIAIASIWSVVALISIFAPTMQTGSDPTIIPIAAFVAPIGGVIATAFASVFAAGSPVRDDERR